MHWPQPPGRDASPSWNLGSSRFGGCQLAGDEPPGFTGCQPPSRRWMVPRRFTIDRKVQSAAARFWSIRTPTSAELIPGRSRTSASAMSVLFRRAGDRPARLALRATCRRPVAERDGHRPALGTAPVRPLQVRRRDQARASQRPGPTQRALRVQGSPGDDAVTEWVLFACAMVLWAITMWQEADRG